MKKGGGTYNCSIVWIWDGLAIQIRPPETNFGSCVLGLHGLEVAKVVLVRGEDVGKLDKVRRLYLSCKTVDVDVMLCTAKFQVAQLSVIWLESEREQTFLQVATVLKAISR